MYHLLLQEHKLASAVLVSHTLLRVMRGKKIIDWSSFSRLVEDDQVSLPSNHDNFIS